MQVLELSKGAGAIPGSGGIAPGNLLMVQARRLVIRPAAFVSRDVGGRREGYLAVALDDQHSEIAFTDARSDGEPHEAAVPDQLLFVGEYGHGLSLRLRLVESDAGLREVLAQVGSLADLLALAVPGGGAAVAALGATQSLTSLLQAGLKDQDEFLLLTRLTRLGDGDVIQVVGRRPDGEVVVELELVITDLGRPRKRRDLLQVSMDQVAVGLPDRLAEPVRRGRRRQPSYERFNFEAASGRARQAVSVRAEPLARLPEVMNWQRLDLFAVRHQRTGSQRYFLPFSWSMALTKDSFRIDDLTALAKEVTALTEALAGSSAEFRRVRKTGMTVLGQFAAAAEEAVLLAAFDGGLLLLPPGLRADGATTPGTVVLPTAADGIWSATVRRETTFAGKPVTSSFRLTVELID